MNTADKLYQWLMDNGPADYTEMWRAMEVQISTLDKAIQALRDQARVREVECREGLAIALEAIDG